MSKQVVKRLMVPSETVSEIARITGLPKSSISEAIRGLKTLLDDALKQGVVVSLGKDFGKFKPHKTARRKHYVPSLDGEVMAGGNLKMKFIPANSMRRVKPKAKRPLKKKA